MAIAARAGEVLRSSIESGTAPGLGPTSIGIGVLGLQPDTGSGLMSCIQAICRDLPALNTNTTYPRLRRLEERRVYHVAPAGCNRLARIKDNMLPYLEALAGSMQRLRNELYAS
ncbi:MAG: hypothetical protein ACXVA3_16825 [Vulcanimicrobiaceae bacterium]